MKNMSNYNNINTCIQEYEDETRGIESEIEMYEYNKKKSQDPDYKSFCDYKIDMRRYHIEDLMECINEQKRIDKVKQNEIQIF